jgi:hypothetical protein
MENRKMYWEQGGDDARNVSPSRTPSFKRLCMQLLMTMLTAAGHEEVRAFTHGEHDPINSEGMVSTSTSVVRLVAVLCVLGFLTGV